MIDERDIERAARELGRRAAGSLDPDRTSAAVLARLRATPVRRWWAGKGVLQMAAALAIVVTGAVAVSRSALQFPAAELAWSPPVSFQGLSEDDLAEVLDSLSHQRPAAASATAALDDLNERELGQLLDLMEG